MSISNLIDENDTLLVKQVDAESANISGLLNVVEVIAVNNITADKIFIAEGEISSESDLATVVGLDTNYFTIGSANGKGVFSKVGNMAKCSVYFQADTIAGAIANQQLSFTFSIPTDYRPATNFGDDVLGSCNVTNQIIFFPPTPVGTPIFVNGVANGNRLANNSIICVFEYTQAAAEALYIGVNAMWSTD